MDTENLIHKLKSEIAYAKISGFDYIFAISISQAIEIVKLLEEKEKEQVRREVVQTANPM